MPIPEISLFPVGNGDMTLLRTGDGQHLLIDCNIRSSADDPDDSTLDVASELKDRLPTDSYGRKYVDAFLLSHPDEDHCRGVQNHFHLGAPKSDIGDKILIRELWSSPIIFRRKSKNHPLCKDAIALASEARRRVKKFRDEGLGGCEDGNRILVLGEDEDGKTDDLAEILVKLDACITSINGAHDSTFSATLLGPLPSDTDEESEALSKNRSSTILSVRLNNGDARAQLLLGGDAGVEVWKRLWGRASLGALDYDFLLCPHHCSWRSLSFDSWSELGEQAKPDSDAVNALSQARDGAVLVASSKPIEDDDSDPPCVRAEREYESIANRVSGEFVCIGDDDAAVTEFEVGALGLRRKVKHARTRGMGAQPLPHG